MPLLSFDQLQKVINVFSPTAGSPGSPLETTQWLRSLQPSLMPRTSLHQGARQRRGHPRRPGREQPGRRRGRTSSPPTRESLAQRVAVRAALVGAGYGLRKLPDADDTAWPAAIARLTGELVEGGAAGGIIYEVMTAARDRSAVEPPRRRAPPWSGRWRRSGSRSTSPAGLPAASARTSSPTTSTSCPLNLPQDDRRHRRRHRGSAPAWAYGHRATRRGLERFFGPGLAHTVHRPHRQRRVLGRRADRALLGGHLPASARRTRRSIPGTPSRPPHPLVSGSAESLCPFERAGPAGPTLRHRRHHPGPDRVHHGRARRRPPHPDLRRVQPATALHLGPCRDRARGDGAHRRLRPRHHPVGLPDRHRLGGPHDDRGRRVLHARRRRHGLHPVRPLPVVPVAAEGAGRSAPVPPAWCGVCTSGCRAMPEDQRPRVLVFGESLGAWAIVGRDHERSASRAWTTTASTAPCGSACLSSPAGPRPASTGRGQLTPEGTVGVFDRWEELEELTPEQRDELPDRAAEPRQRPDHA